MQCIANGLRQPQNNPFSRCRVDMALANAESAGLLMEQQRATAALGSGRKGACMVLPAVNRMMGGYESSGDKLKFKGVATTA